MYNRISIVGMDNYYLNTYLGLLNEDDEDNSEFLAFESPLRGTKQFSFERSFFCERPTYFNYGEINSTGGEVATPRIHEPQEEGATSEGAADSYSSDELSGPEYAGYVVMSTLTADDDNFINAEYEVKQELETNSKPATTGTAGYFSDKPLVITSNLVYVTKETGKTHSGTMLGAEARSPQKAFFRSKLRLKDNSVFQGDLASVWYTKQPKWVNTILSQADATEALTKAILLYSGYSFKHQKLKYYYIFPTLKFFRGGVLPYKKFARLKRGVGVDNAF